VVFAGNIMYSFCQSLVYAVFFYY